jgi:hypothetical protein
MNIGDKVKYKDVYDEPSVGVIVDVSSSMPSYDDMKLEDGVPYYISKKMSVHEIEPVYVAVKPKNMDTVFLIIETNRGRTEFLSLNEVIIYE